VTDGGDTITDFAKGADKIDLSALDAVAGGADDAFAFQAAQNAATVANTVTWRQADGQTFIHADVNGDSVADFTLKLNGTINLAASDFIL
jgi:plastocyanin